MSESAIERLTRWFGYDPREIVFVKLRGTDRSPYDHCVIFSKKKRGYYFIEDDEQSASLYRDLITIGTPVLLRSELGHPEEEDVVNELFGYNIPLGELAHVYQVVWGTAKSEHKDALRSTLEKHRIPPELISKIFALSEQNSS
ncbi:MAG: hypothetical protein ACK5PB_03850 [Pirellula sp.]|jgi:hypothetical protein